MTNQAVVPHTNGVLGGRIQTAPIQLDATSLAEIFIKSGYFKDTRDVSQAITKILYGQEHGIPPIQSMLGIHVIEGKPTMSAGLMASMINRSGRYHYRMLKNDRDGCALEFFDGTRSLGKSDFTRQDATDAGLIGKPVWKAYFRNMAFARALSNGARWYCPDVFGGPIYVPEELNANVDANGDVIDVAPVFATPTTESATATPSTTKPPRADAVLDGDRRLAEDGGEVLWRVGPERVLCYQPTGKSYLQTPEVCPLEGHNKHPWMCPLTGEPLFRYGKGRERCDMAAAKQLARTETQIAQDAFNERLGVTATAADADDFDDEPED